MNREDLTIWLAALKSELSTMRPGTGGELRGVIAGIEGVLATPERPAKIVVVLEGGCMVETFASVDATLTLIELGEDGNDTLDDYETAVDGLLPVPYPA